MDLLLSGQPEESVSLSRFYRNTGVYKSRERTCDRVARCHLDKCVSSSLIGGCRLFSIMLSGMLSIAL